MTCQIEQIWKKARISKKNNLVVFKNKSNVKMGISNDVNSKRARASERNAEIDNILRDCVNSRFGFENIVEEMMSKMVKHMGRETIQVKQFLNNLKLNMKDFIAGTHVENSTK